MSIYESKTHYLPVVTLREAYGALGRGGLAIYPWALTQMPEK